MFLGGIQFSLHKQTGSKKLVLNVGVILEHFDINRVNFEIF